jgi:4-amino-4-deoxy-L-arabinose transferase-like glycosyltransferase
MDKVTGAVRAFLPEFLLLLAFGAVLLLNVGVFDIDPYSELFHLESAKESLLAGRFWIPTLHGADYLIRAPFWTWVLIIMFKVLGVSLWAARLPAVICAMLSMVFTYLMAMELTQSRFSSFFAAAALGSTWGFFHMGSLSTAEILGTAIYTAFGWALLQWHSFARRKTTLPVEMDTFSAILGGLLGLLLLVKGTVGFLVLLGIAVLYLVLTQSVSLVQKMNWGLVALPLILIPLPWIAFVSLMTKNPLFVADYLVTMPLERWLGIGPWHELRIDWLFYLKRLPWDLMPYVLLIPGAFLDNGMLMQRGAHQASSSTTWLTWLCGWFALGVLVYSSSVFQEPSLMLPFYPPVAIIAGYYLGQVLEASSGQKAEAYDNTLVAYIAVLMFGAVLGSVLVFQIIPSNYVAGFWHFPGQALMESLNLGKHQIDLPEAFPLWKFWLVPGPCILLLGGFLLFLFQSERRTSTTPFILLGTMVIFLLFVKVLYLPIMHRPIAERFAQQINRQAKASDQIILYSLNPDVKRVLFYLDADKLARTRIVNKPQEVAQVLIDPPGAVYGVIRENSYFRDLSPDTRDLLQVRGFGWKWDMSRLSQMGKLVLGHQPQFESMKSKVMYFQSLSPVILQAVREADQPIVVVEESPRKRRR